MSNDADLRLTVRRNRRILTLVLSGQVCAACGAPRSIRNAML